MGIRNLWFIAESQVRTLYKAALSLKSSHSAGSIFRSPPSHCCQFLRVRYMRFAAMV